MVNIVHSALARPAVCKNEDVTERTDISVCALSAHEYLRRIDRLVDIHLRAMNYPQETFLQRRQLWISNARKDGFVCVTALEHPAGREADPADPRHRSVGVAYGFPGTGTSWWYREVNRGLRDRGLSADEAGAVLSDYDEVSEVHVAPGYQGRGIGHRMLDALLPRLHHGTAMLSTPEVDHESNAAWSLYRHLGFEDVLRNFRFGSDPRPFGVLALDRAK